jgi:hypothetical protein
MKIFDRYSLLCISVSVIILTAVFTNQDEPADHSTIGIVHDIKTTQSGYTFMLEDSNGGQMKCFTRVEPADHSIYSIKGTMSEDGSIFFVSSMAMLQNELNRN